jgi:drug/metabolite transporter superfamily protein YnfA
MNDLDLRRELRTLIDDAATPVSATEARLRSRYTTPFLTRWGQWRPWTHRLAVVAVAVAIVVVFFVPLPHLNLFKRLVGPAKTSPATSGSKTPSIGGQLALLKPSGAAADSSFGYGLAISGRTAVVADHDGAVYVLAGSGSKWRQVAELKGPATAEVDGFGTSVAISGATVVVGSPGHSRAAGLAYVFTETAGRWHQVAELKGSDIVANDEFGNAVAIAGTTIVVGTNPVNGDLRGAYVFTKIAGVWKQVTVLKGSDTVAGDGFGYAVAISGATIVVGASGHASAAGRAYVFIREAGVWKQVAELKGSDTVTGDQFGSAVSISGAAIIVGATGHASGAGRVYGFTRSATGWTQTAELKASDSAPGDQFGSQVALSGRAVVVGAFGNQSAGESYIFTKVSAGWKQVAMLRGFITDVDNGYNGPQVAISGTTALMSGNSTINSGGAYLVRA